MHMLPEVSGAPRKPQDQVIPPKGLSPWASLPSLVLALES